MSVDGDHVQMKKERQPGLFELPPEEAMPWELADGDDALIARVVFNRPLDTVYHYLVPESLLDLIQPGQRVRVPFGRGDTLTTAFCVGLSNELSNNKRLKTLHEVLDREPLLTQRMLDLTEWIADRYLSSWGQVLEGVVPAGVKKQAGTREILFYRIADNLGPLDDFKLPKKQRLLLETLAKADSAMRVDQLSQSANCGTSPINSLRDKKLIVPEKKRTHSVQLDELHVEKQEDLKLNHEQQHALDEILTTVRSAKHETILLHGVTGSGKTEVYIQAIREIVSYGQQAIVLVPEISLTPQTIRRFRARFSSVAVLHSHLSDADRHWHWKQIAAGEIQVIVGARSAIFAPTPRLGLIIIDEEHESTFKQQSTPRYHAREVARQRAIREEIPLILGTATPTLESLVRTIEGQDKLIRLKDRVEKRPLPPVSIVDVRNDPMIMKRHSLGRALTNSIQQAIRSGGQVILFLNLRGFSSVLWCPKCQGLKCPDCDLTLTWHKDRELLLCHSCEFEMESPERCPTCGQPGLRFLGAGTQRLEAEVKSKFPDARIIRMDSDSMRKPGSHDAALSAFRDGDIDILLGTQMIAKGLDFPNVTLVGVIDADTLLHQPDLRASERTFQLIAQVAGRTGRGTKGGRVLVQTMNPDEPVIKFATHHDYDGFARYELKHRKAMKAPPFCSMARVILRSLDEKLVGSESKRIVQAIREIIKEKGIAVRVLGPAPAPITRLRKYYRYHFQMTSEKIITIQELWRQIVPLLKVASDVELTIDVDPVDLR